MTRDDIEVAKLAAITAGALNQVDAAMMERSSKGPANRIGDPRRFINNQGNPAPQNIARPINNPNIIQAPVARSAGREIIGTEAVDVGSLLIPMPEGVTIPPPPPVPQPTRTGNIINGPVPIQQTYSPSDFEERFIKLEKKVNKIDKKLNTLLKKIK